MQWTKSIKVGVLALVMAQAPACADSGNLVELKGQRFQVELALTREKHALGLMFRNSMPRDHGMLFIFPEEAPRSFWMRNTRIPLDILYFDEAWKLVSIIHNARPCVVQACPNYPSEFPARYVLEINGGMARDLGIDIGDRLEVLFDL